jgi:hypothetical protein
VALAQLRPSTHFCDSLAGNGIYAEGGAREARCSENELLGAGCCASGEYRAISSGAAMRSRAAAASTGKCSDWQMWQAVSEPFACWWSRLPPAAKYSKTAHANTATARRTAFRAKIRPKIVLPRCMTLPGRVTPLTHQPKERMQNVDPYPITLLDPATIPA